MSYIVAVDGGGTSTRAVVASSDARCLGYAKSGPGNPVSAGAEVAADSFEAAISGALAAAGVAAGAVTGVLFSMAGGISAPDLPLFFSRLRGLGLNAEPVLEGDLQGVFCAGVPDLSGYAVEAGTGSAAVRFEAGRAVALADGLGWLVGDAGSGFWIGHQAARAAFEDLDGRGPATALTALVLADLGLPLDRARSATGRPPAVDAGMKTVYAMRPVQLSRLSRLAFEAAGDPVADAIVRGAAEGLAKTLLAVAVPEVPGPVVFGGGVLTRNPGLMAQVKALVAGQLPAVRDAVVVTEGTLGAVVLALRHHGVEVSRPQFDRLQATLAALTA
jgi:N-acetylglucosamine kinase-like BadF-type ATPase